MTVDTEIVHDPYGGVDWTSYGQYKAQHHAHGAVHSGDNAAHEVIDFYADHDYDILSLLSTADRNHWPWTELSQIDDHTAEDRYPIGTHDDAPSEDVKVDLIAVEGHEPSTGSDDEGLGDQHLGVYFCNVNDDDWGSTSPTIEEVLSEVEANNGIAVINHPRRYVEKWEYEKYLEYFDEWDVLRGFESLEKSAPNFGALRIWDDTAAAHAPERSVYGWSNDDRAEDLNDPGSNGSLSRWNVVLAPELSYDAVRDAYDKGSWYIVSRKPRPLDEAATVPTITEIDHDSSAKTITITATDYEEIEWVSVSNVVGTGATFDYGETATGPTLRAQLWNGPAVVASTQNWLCNPSTKMIEENGSIRPMYGIDTTRDETSLETFGRLNVGGNLDTTGDETYIDTETGDLHVGGDYGGDL